MHRHPKQKVKDSYPKKELRQPFESENEMAECAGETLRQTHSDDGHGGGAITRDDSDNPVQNDKPFKNLKG